MLAGQSSSYLNLLKAIIAGWLVVMIASCTVVKKYQPNKPFVYKTNINLIGNFTNDEKESLISSLKGQLDDSIRVRKVDKLVFSEIRHPPLYDSTNADKSIIFMRALLVSLGYFNDTISYRDTVIKVGTDQQRTHITFDVKPGKVWRFDTIIYNMQHPELQRLTDSTMKQAYIKKGDAFSKAPIAIELDRLTELYRDNGYLRFGRDELVGLWDTLDVALLRPTSDPFEQLEILQKLKERRNNPTVNLEIRLRSIDSARLTKYYNGNVTIYPDFSIDTAGIVPDTAIVDKIKVIQFRNTFKTGIFPDNIYLPRDSVYRQRRYNRTINRLNLIGAWRMVNIDQLPRKEQDTVDFIIRLTPAKRYSFTANLEGSINQSAISGKLFGVGVNTTLQNRNKWRSANLANSNIRYGVEFGTAGTSQFIQTKQISASHSIYFPRAILIERFIPENRRDNFRTILSANAANTERRLLFNLTTVNGSWGYEFQRRRLLLNVKFPNIEYSFLNKKDSLDSLIKINPSLKNIFTDGLVFSLIGNLTLSGGRDNHLNVFHANIEAAPLFAGLFHSAFLDSQIYRFIKIDAEVARLIRYRKTSVALRFFAGIGIADPFNTAVNANKRSTLPFFKQYFSGGPNSMRAWQLRRLGPGSTVKDFVGSLGSPDRYGDVQLEFNAEYRFPIFKPLKIPVDGAIFTDIGNVWLLKKKAGTPEQVFNINRLGKDIAIGAGAGLRINFGFFIVRLDYSYKVKDPSPALVDQALQNKWFGYKFFKGNQFQLGIGLPFIF